MTALFASYWPFWLGALALAAIAVGFMLATGRGLGVSGALSTVLDLDAMRAEARGIDMAQVQARLVAETAEMLKSLTPEQRLKMAEDVPEAMVVKPAAAPKLTWSSYTLFLASLALGGTLASFTRGQGLVTSFDTTYAALFGTGPLAFATLFVGGLLVGAGTRLAGGCTSGHGLVGIARMQWPSLVATAIFFGTAIVVSFVLRGAT